MEEEFLSCTSTVVDGNDYKESDCWLWYPFHWPHSPPLDGLREVSVDSAAEQRLLVLEYQQMWSRRKCWIDSADNCGQQSNPFIHWNMAMTRTEPQTLFGHGTDGKVVVVVCAYQGQSIWSSNSSFSPGQTHIHEPFQSWLTAIAIRYSGGLPQEHVPAIRSVVMILLLFGRKRIHGATIGSCQLQLIEDYSTSSAGGGNGYILWDTMQSTVISTTTESIKEIRGGGEGLVQLWLNCTVAQQQTNWNTKWLMNNNGQGLPCTLALRNRRRSTLNKGPCTLGCGYEWCNKVRNRAGNHKGE